MEIIIYIFLKRKYTINKKEKERFYYSLVSSYLKFYIDKFQFLFLSYNDVHSDDSTKGAGNITCISEECANQQVHTKQCEGEIKVSLTLTGKKAIISQLQDLPVYMFKI